MNVIKRFILPLVIIFVLGIIAFAAYSLTVQKNRTISVNPPGVTPTGAVSPTQTITSPLQTTPAEAVAGFYAQYEDCMKNPPKPATGQVGLYCQSHNPFITGTFVTNLERGGVAKAGADPVVCAQNFPQNIKVGNSTVQGNTTKVKVIETFGPSTVEPILSLLKQENGWRVDNITCPKP